MKKGIKTFILFIFVAVISVLACACAEQTANAADAEGSFIDAAIQGGGNAEVTVNVSKEKAESVGIQDLSSFKEYFNGYIAVLNGASEDVDVLKVKDYDESDDGYSVGLTTRRIDKIGGLGTIEYRVASTFATFEQQMDKIESYYDGVNEKIAKNLYPVTEDKTVQIYRIPTKGNDYEIYAQRYIGNGLQRVSYSDFANYLKNSDDKIVFFKLAGFTMADSIVLRINGELKYVSSDGVEVIDNNTLRIVPKSVVTDDGQTIEVFFGYFVYTPGLSVFATVMIITGCVALAVLIFLCIRFRWLQNFFHSRTFAQVKKYKILYLMILPGLALLILFHYLPLAGLVTAFQKYDIFDGYNSEFVGLKNFSNIFYASNSDKMYTIFRNTIFISLIRIVTNFPIILITALVVQSIKKRRVKAVYQAISFIPYFISWAAVGGMAYALLSTNSGLINSILIKLGKDPVKWYTTPEPWWWILAITSLWKGMGWATLIYIAAMCNIDSSLYEACSLDGGGTVRQAIHVTLPSIMNVICLQLILDAGNIMKDNYEQILALVPGDTSSLNTSIEVIGKYTFSQLNGAGMGAATAMGLIQSIIGLLLVLFVNNIVRKTENEGVI